MKLLCEAVEVDIVLFWSASCFISGLSAFKTHVGFSRNDLCLRLADINWLYR